MSLWRDSLSRRVRQRVLRHYLVPYSRFGLDSGLVPHLAERSPVTLVDIGANRGDFAATIEAHCGIRRALLVEPQPARCEELRGRFPTPAFHVRNCALLDREGAAGLDVLGADRCSSLLPVKAEMGFAGRGIDTTVRERIQVPVATLDALLSEPGWEMPIDVLKIDTQGTELQVLQGGRASLARVRLLWIEVSFRSLYEGSALFPEIHEFLGRAHFKLYSLHEVFRGEDQELLQADALFLGPLARTSSP